MSITVYVIKPFILDIPQLATGNFNYVTGKDKEIEIINRDPVQTVYLYGGTKVTFVFASGVSKDNNYKIGYLTHTKRAIYFAQINEFNGVENPIGLPIFEFIIFLFIFIIMIVSILIVKLMSLLWHRFR